MKKIIFIFTLFAFSISLLAQMPKWAKKTNKQMLTLVTYDSQGSVLDTTNAFPIQKGEILTDYHTLKGAAQALVFDVKGKSYSVERILGCNAIYDVIRCSVPSLKVKPLPLATDTVGVGAPIFVQPSLTAALTDGFNSIVADVQLFNNNYPYYSFSGTVTRHFTSCPILNEKGQVLGLLQPTVLAKDTMLYAISVAFGASLETNALAANSSDVRDLRIPMNLPADPNQATTFIYLTGSADSALYQTYLSDYRRLFPTEPNGYTLQGEFYTANQHFAEAEDIWQQGLKNKVKPDEIYYSKARCIYEVLRVVPRCPETWTLQQALEDIRQAYAVNPLPLYTSLEAQILYSSTNYAEACEKFIALNSTNLRSSDQFLYASQCQLMLNDTLAALALQDSAVAFYSKPYMPEASRPLLMRANTLLSLNRYVEGIQDLNEYERLERKNLNANFYYKRYLAEMQCRMYQQAVDDIETACRLAPEEPVFFAEKAVVYYRFDEMEEAIKAARAALALDDTFADAHRILSICLQQQGLVDEAQQHLRKAAELGDELAKTMLAQ